MPYSENQIGLVPSHNGELNIQYNGRTLYSRYNPSSSAERLAGKTQLTPRTIYFLPSPLLGYGISHLLEQLPENSILLGIETDQEIMKISSPALERFHKEGISEFYRLDEPVTLYRIFNHLSPGQYRSCRMIVLNGGYQLNNQKYDSLFDSLEHFLQNYWQNRLTSVKLGRLWMKNLISNLAWSDGKTLSEFKTTKAVILAGAGESLEQTIPLIQKARQDFFILAVDTAIQTLMRSGIYPDGIVNLEAQFHNLKDFYPLLGKNIRQFTDLTVYPPSLRQFGGEHYFFSSRFGSTAIMDRLQKADLLPPAIPALGSVGVTALYVAGEISEGPIFLTGLDFSYVPGKSHAKESPFHDWARLQENRLKGDMWYSFTCSRPSIAASAKNNVSYLRTNPILMSYGKQLKDMSRLMPRQVYDLTEMGLDLKIPFLSPQEALEMAQNYRKNTKKQEKTNRNDTQRKKEEIKKLLKREKDCLEELIDLWENVNSHQSEPEVLTPLLRYCDYIYFHFPDTGSLPNTEPAFLVRAIRSARTYSRLLTILLDGTE